MRTANKLLKIIILLQVGYFILAIIAAYLGYLIGGKIEAEGNVMGWRVGGAIGAFILIHLVLISTGPHRTLLKRHQQEQDQEMERQRQEIEKRQKLPVRAEVIFQPGKDSDYEEIFEGFDERTFRAFNAPFQLEEEEDRPDVYKAALDVHLRRYERGLRSNYLFYDKGSYERAREFFVIVQKRALRENISLAGKIQLRCLLGQPAPSYTYFFGYRSGEARCIMYPSAVLRGGLPGAVLVIDGAEDLLKILLGHFEEQWAQAKKSSDCEAWSPSNNEG